MLLHYLIHQCQTNKALLFLDYSYSNWNYLYTSCVCALQRRLLYTFKKYHFDNDKGFSKKKSFSSQVLRCTYVWAVQKEPRGKKYHVGAGSLLSLDLHHSFLKLNMGWKMYFWVLPPNYTVRFWCSLFHQKVKLFFPFALRFACSLLLKFSRWGSYLHWIIHSKFCFFVKFW